MATRVQVALGLWTHIQQQGCPLQNCQMGAGYENTAAWGPSWKLYPLNWVTETWDSEDKVHVLYFPAYGLSVDIHSISPSALNSSPSYLVNVPYEYQLGHQIESNIFIYDFSAII